MERNGKKHGMVYVAVIAKPASKTPAAPPIAKRFAKAPTKPANHSKFTGKCRRGARAKESRSIPESKSRDKAKGARKLKSCDVLLNHRLVAWRVVDASADDDEGEEGRRRRHHHHHHLSATEMVEKLYANCNTLHESLTMEEEEEEEEEEEAEKEFNGGDEERDETDGGDEETEMDFHAVAGVSWDCVEGEEWLLVAET